MLKTTTHKALFLLLSVILPMSSCVCIIDNELSFSGVREFNQEIPMLEKGKKIKVHIYRHNRQKWYPLAFNKMFRVEEYGNYRVVLTGNDFYQLVKKKNLSIESVYIYANGDTLRHNSSKSFANKIALEVDTAFKHIGSPFYIKTDSLVAHKDESLSLMISGKTTNSATIKPFNTEIVLYKKELNGKFMCSFESSE